MRCCLKPGKLDDDEFAIMKRHAEIGRQILQGHSSGNRMLHMAAEIALAHHEKFDGTGYPRRLAGEAIPLVGRIVAVADVFDALTSPRPYKRAWSLEDATAFLRDNAGSVRTSIRVASRTSSPSGIGRSKFVRATRTRSRKSVPRRRRRPASADFSNPAAESANCGRTLMSPVISSAAS